MSNLLKKLQKILRRYRGLAIFGSILLLLGAVTLMSIWVQDRNAPELLDGEDQSIDVMATQVVNLIIQTKYLCGTETEIKEFNNAEELETWLEKQPFDWQLSAKKEDVFTINREVHDDLSPLCKKEGYFGVTKEGVLTLFQGPPMENQVIQTFYRIDTELLESKLPREEVGFLKQGIKIHNVGEYLSILSTYGEFAVEY